MIVLAVASLFVRRCVSLVCSVSRLRNVSVSQRFCTWISEGSDGRTVALVVTIGIGPAPGGACRRVLLLWALVAQSKFDHRSCVLFFSMARFVWITGSGVMAAGLSVYPPNIHVSKRQACGHIIRSLYPNLHQHRTHAATQRKLQCQETSRFVCDLLGMSVAVRRPPIKPICVLREEEQ